MVSELPREFEMYQVTMYFFALIQTKKFQFSFVLFFSFPQKLLIGPWNPWMETSDFIHAFAAFFKHDIF